MEYHLKHLSLNKFSYDLNTVLLGNGPTSLNTSNQFHLLLNNSARNIFYLEYNKRIGTFFNLNCIFESHFVFLLVQFWKRKFMKRKSSNIFTSTCTRDMYLRIPESCSCQITTDPSKYSIESSKSIIMAAMVSDTNKLEGSPVYSSLYYLLVISLLLSYCIHSY